VLPFEDALGPQCRLQLQAEQKQRAYGSFSKSFLGNSQSSSGGRYDTNANERIWLGLRRESNYFDGHLNLTVGGYYICAPTSARRSPIRSPA